MVVPEPWAWSRREHGQNEACSQENSCISLKIPKDQGVKVLWVCSVTWIKLRCVSLTSEECLNKEALRKG